MTMTIAIDLAKTAFELAAADESGRVLERRRLSRQQLTRYFSNRSVGKVVMEACGTAHYWHPQMRSSGMPLAMAPSRARTPRACSLRGERPLFGKSRSERGRLLLAGLSQLSQTPPRTRRTGNIERRRITGTVTHWDGSDGNLWHRVSP
jgi:hypothetical protein